MESIATPPSTLGKTKVNYQYCMGLLPDTQNRGLRMRRERSTRHRLQGKPLISDPSIHHGMSATHVPWCMSGSLHRDGGENDPGIPSAWATSNFTYLARGPCMDKVILLELYIKFQFNSLRLSEAYTHQYNIPTLLQPSDKARAKHSPFAKNPDLAIIGERISGLTKILAKDFQLLGKK